MHYLTLTLTRFLQNLRISAENGTKDGNFVKMLSDSCKRCSTFNKFAKFAIFVQTCKILVKNASLVRI